VNDRMRRTTFRRWLTALGGDFKRALLGESAHAYMKQFRGSDEFWATATAHHPAAHRQPALPPVANPSPGSGQESTGTTPADARRLAWHAGAGWEPVHGWTRRQAGAYLARNPGYVLAYDVELRKHPGWATSASF